MAATEFPTPPNTPIFVPGGIARTLETKSKGKQKENELAQPAPPELSETGGASSTDRKTSANPWSAIIASACDHPDVHLVKVIRTLCLAASLFGHSPPGYMKSSLEGTDIMDGSIFIRAAGMTLDTSKSSFTRKQLVSKGLIYLLSWLGKGR